MIQSPTFFGPRGLLSTRKDSPPRPAFRSFSMKFAALLRHSSEDLPELTELFRSYKQLKKRLKTCHSAASHQLTSFPFKSYVSGKRYL